MDKASAQRLADKYVSSDGGEPLPSIASENDNQLSDANRTLEYERKIRALELELEKARADDTSPWFYFVGFLVIGFVQALTICAFLAILMPIVT